MRNPTTTLSENNHVEMENEVAATRFRSLDIREGIVDIEIPKVSTEYEEGEEIVRMGEDMTTPILEFEDYNGEGIGALIKVNA